MPHAKHNPVLTQACLCRAPRHGNGGADALIEIGGLIAATQKRYWRSSLQKPSRDTSIRILSAKKEFDVGILPNKFLQHDFSGYQMVFIVCSSGMMRRGRRHTENNTERCYNRN